jgi:hypothetical protein
MRIARSFAIVTAVIAFSLQGTAAAAQQADATHEHSNEHRMHGDASAALVSKLELQQDGLRWPTDASLRTGMANIRAAFDADHPAIHAGKQTDAQYDALAATVEREVNFIVANCKLEAAADAQLHYVVGDMLQAVSLLRGGDPARSRHDGAHLLHGALNAYGKYFDDPSWAAASSGNEHGNAHENGHDH